MCIMSLFLASSCDTSGLHQLTGKVINICIQQLQLIQNNHNRNENVIAAFK